MNIYRALKFAYRHSWGSSRLGFFNMLVIGWHIYFKSMTPEEQQLEAVQLRSMSSIHNTNLHRFSQYNNHDGTNIFTAREPGLHDLETPSRN